MHRFCFAYGIVAILAGLSLAPLFADPFHEKDTQVCFWECVTKEIWELINGEVQG